MANELGNAFRKQEIRKTLFEYLAACPMAMDTLDGIAQFWLPRQRVHTDVTLLSEVLTELAAEGSLEVIGIGDRRSYRLSSTSWSAKAGGDPDTAK